MKPSECWNCTASGCSMNDVIHCVWYYTSFLFVYESSRSHHTDVWWCKNIYSCRIKRTSGRFTGSETVSVERWCLCELTSPSVRREAVSVFSSVIRTNPGHQSELSGCSPVVRHNSNGSSVCSSAFVHRGRQNQQRTAKEKVPRCSFKSKEVTLGGVIWILLDLTSVSTSISTTSPGLISRISEDVRRSSRQRPQNNKCLMILLSLLSVQIF